MSAVSDLIKVSYHDRTNYTENAGNDVMGSLFEHHWGPVNLLRVLSKTEFFADYPESLPMGAITVDTERYFPYSQIMRAFNNGISQVEVSRVQGSWKYQEFNITDSANVSGGGIVTPPSVDEEVTLVATETQFAAISTTPIIISTKYPGFFPKNLLNGYDGIGISISTSGDTIFISILGITLSSLGTITIGTDKYVADTANPIETFEGGIDVSALSDGASSFIENVVHGSNYISVKVKDGLSKMPIITAHTMAFMPCGAVGFEFPQTTPDYSNAINVFSDSMVSSATLLISPLKDTSLDATLLDIAKTRNEIMPVIGYPVASPFTKTDIKSFLTSLSTVRNMFGIFVAGREKVSVFGLPLQSNCVGGYCGSMAMIADTVRLNQIASAFTYGAFRGTLISSLTFDEVSDLMKLGVTSVFSTTNGPLIWGTRTLNTKQTSYFGKINVVRVLTSILRSIFPIALGILHTGAAADEIERSNANTLFNDIISDHISKRNLQDDSYADCLGDINSDSNTKGGTVFNLVLSLHFIGLVESIQISVYATDSSVKTNLNS